MMPKCQKTKRRKTIQVQVTANNVQLGGNAKTTEPDNDVEGDNKAVLFSIFITEAEGIEPVIIDALLFIMFCVRSV